MGRIFPKVLWAYRTTRKSTTRETLFAFVFGTEAVAPVEVGLKSPRVEFANAEHNEESLCLNLDLLEEKREQALKRAEDYNENQHGTMIERSGLIVLSR